MIDLRSDTVTRPSDEMRHAIASAEVGDDVWGDDPTVTKLEQTTASLLGKQAALFVPSGTQSNLCALMAHCQRGDEYVVGENAHTFKYEAGGAAVLGSIQPQTVRTDRAGVLDLDHVRKVMKPDDDHFARTRLLCLENSHDGHVLSLEYQQQAASVAKELGLAFHLDGARLWNAAAELGVEPSAVAEPFDSVSVCLSKGLGAPVGSVLVGTPELIKQARKWRKMLGGALRQSGILAAAGLYALENNRARMIEDHANAKRLASKLGEIDGVTVNTRATNMVFAHFEGDSTRIVNYAAEHNVLVRITDGASRMVTHLDVSQADIDTTVEVLAEATK